MAPSDQGESHRRPGPLSTLRSEIEPQRALQGKTSAEEHVGGGRESTAYSTGWTATSGLCPHGSGVLCSRPGGQSAATAEKKYFLLSSLSILLAAVHKSRLEPGPKISRPKLPFYRRPKRPREKKKSSAFEERKSEQKGILESSCKNWAPRFTFFPGLSLEIRLLPTIELVLSLADVALDEVKMVQVLHDVPLSLYFSRGCKIERENIFLPSLPLSLFLVTSTVRSAP